MNCTSPYFIKTLCLCRPCFSRRWIESRRFCPLRLKPYRITPWHTAVSITAYQYRKSDLGPYNKVGIGVAVTIDKETSLFAGILTRTPETPMSYTYRLPVTTEIAREVGVEFAGYPKFVADIDFEDEGNWVICKLVAGDQHVLTLSGRKLPVHPVSRFRADPLTCREGMILRSQLVMSERDMGTSRSAQDVKLELGEHSISQELRDLQLGRVLNYGYCPQAQAILTPVFESFVA